MIAISTLTAADRDHALAGDADAMDRFIKSVDSSIVAMARVKNMPSHLVEECIQEMRLAMLKALPKWNPEIASWATYALNRARGAMLDYLRSQSLTGYKRSHEAAPPHVSTSKFTVESENMTIGDLLESPESDDGYQSVDLCDLRDVMHAHSAHLRMLAMYCLDQMTMKKIAKAIGISESRVSQIMSQIKSDSEVIDHVRRLAGVA